MSLRNEVSMNCLWIKKLFQEGFQNLKSRFVFFLLIWYNLKPYLQEISDFANMLREVFRDFSESAQAEQESRTLTSPSGLRTGHRVGRGSFLVALNNNLPRLDSKKFKWNLSNWMVVLGGAIQGRYTRTSTLRPDVREYRIQGQWFYLRMVKDMLGIIELERISDSVLFGINVKKHKFNKYHFFYFLRNP